MRLKIPNLRRLAVIKIYCGWEQIAQRIFQILSREIRKNSEKNQLDWVTLIHYLNGPTIMPVGHIGAHREGAEGVKDYSQLQPKGVQVEGVGWGARLRQLPKVNSRPGLCEKMRRVEMKNVGVGKPTGHPAQLLHSSVSIPMEQEESWLHLIPYQEVVARRAEAEWTLRHWFTPAVVPNLKGIA